MYLAYSGSDAGSGSAADECAFEAVAEDRAKRGAACAPDQGTLAWPDAALAVLVVTVVVALVPAIVIARIVVISASAAVAHSPIESGVVPVAVIVASVPIPIPVPVLSAERKQTRSDEQQNDENKPWCFHPEL